MGQGFQTEVRIVPDTCKQKKKPTQTGAVQLLPGPCENLLWTSGSSLQEPGAPKRRSQPPFQNQGLPSTVWAANQREVASPATAAWIDWGGGGGRLSNEFFQITWGCQLGFVIHKFSLLL